MNINAQEMIAKAFGFKEMFSLEHFIVHEGKKVSAFKISAKDAKNLYLSRENNEPCAMCGNIHPNGYKSKIDSAHLLSAMLSDTYNECYALQQGTNFICEYCGFAMVSYGSPEKQKGYGKKMINCVVDENRYEEKYFNSDKDNQLYWILKNPPKTPFVVLINSRGTVIENLTFTARATISKGLIVVNYGLENLYVNKDEVFAAIESASEIARKAKIEITADNIWNRQNDVKISLNKKLREDKEFLKDMGIFIARFNRETRVVAKMILAAYLKENKTGIETHINAETNTSEPKQSLFDF